MRKYLKSSLITISLALAGCNQPELPKAPKNTVYSKPGTSPLDKSINYEGNPDYFHLTKKFKDGKEVVLKYTGSILKITEFAPKGRYITMGDIDFNDKGIEIIVDNIFGNKCYSFQDSKTPRCISKELKEKNKLFNYYLKLLKFKEHKMYWNKTKKAREDSDGFNLEDI